MSQIKIEAFDSHRHHNEMWRVDHGPGERYWRAPSLIKYQVCLVEVCNFAFIFHSVKQLAACLEYYRLRHQPSGRLPFYTWRFGDHGEAHQWFSRLPKYLLEKPKRRRVINALEKAMHHYSLAVPETLENEPPS